MQIETVTIETDTTPLDGLLHLTDQPPVEVKSEARILFGARQTGVAPDGSVPDTIEEQARLVWSN
jgi:hypothetical protein